MATALELTKKEKEELETKKRIAELLKTDVQALKEFETAYAKTVLTEPATNDFFSVNAKQAANAVNKPAVDVATEDIINRIVNELLAQTDSMTAFSDGRYEVSLAEGHYDGTHVTAEEIYALPEKLRPQLTGTLMKIDVPEPSYQAVLSYYLEYLKAPDTREGRRAYNLFRQGLDILDLDPIMYDIIGMNWNSIRRWLPFLCEAVNKQSFFKIPETRVIKVPITLLQLTRCEYGQLTPTTLAIVDRFCQKVFSLDVSKDYFIKTGTYSSKYDFRNCYIHGEKKFVNWANTFYSSITRLFRWHRRYRALLSLARLRPMNGRFASLSMIRKMRQPSTRVCRFIPSTGSSLTSMPRKLLA